jgi:polar amino acid transport system substrate-binding protein
MMKEPGMRNVKLILGSILSFTCAAALPLTGFAQTLERIQQAGSVTIGFLSDQAPFSEASAGGASGYAIDLCLRAVDAAKEKLGVGKLDVKYRSTGTVDSGLNLLAGGDIDLLCGAVTDTLKRREKVSFSIPIYNGGTGAVIRTDAPEVLRRVLQGKVAHEGPVWRSTINRGLANHTYVVHRGTTDEAWVRKQVATLGVVATVIEVDDTAKGIAMVADGDADAYFGDRTVLQQYVTEQKDLEVLDRYFNFQALAIAMARGDEDMRLVVDTALSRLYRSDEFEGVYSQYLGAPGDFTLKLFRAYARP